MNTYIIETFETITWRCKTSAPDELTAYQQVFDAIDAKEQPDFHLWYVSGRPIWRDHFVKWVRKQEDAS